MKNTRTLVTSLLTLVVAIWFADQSLAQTLTWSGSSAANANSSNTQNWVGGTAPPGNADRAFVFDTQYLAGSKRTAVTWSTGTSGWTSLTLAAGGTFSGFTLGGSTGVTLKGPVTVSSGTHLWRTATTLATDSTWNISAGATLTRDTDNALTLPANLKITKTGAGELSITGTNNSGLFLGTIEVQQGVLSTLFSNNAFGSGTIALNGGTFSLTANAGLSNASTSTRLLGNSTVTTNRGSTAGAGAQFTMGSLSAGAATLTVTAGSLVTSGTQDLVYGATTLTGAATLEPANNATSTTRLTLGAIGEAGGAFGFTKSGDGQVLLTAAGSYSGGTTLAVGTLLLADDAALGSGGLAINGGTLSSSSVTARTLGNAVTIGGSVALAPASTGTLQLNGTVDLGASVRTVNVGSVAVLAGQVSGAGGGITKTGSGTAILAGNNSYTGASTVSLGTLLVNGDQSTATGAVTVAAGATLGGSGTIGGAVTVNGILAPGTSPGVLSVASLTLNASGTSLFEINGLVRGTDYDGVNITGATGPTYGGTLSLVFGNGSAFADNSTFDLFNFGSLTPGGAFSSVTSTGFYVGTWTNNNDGTYKLESGSQTLTFSQATGDIVVVPEPAGLAMAAIGIAAAAWASRKRE
jgi:fibronectin-binding autotransporter adhesin